MFITIVGLRVRDHVAGQIELGKGADSALKRGVRTVDTGIKMTDVTPFPV